MKLVERPLLPIVAAAVFVVGACSQSNAQSSSHATLSEKHFVSEALKGGMAEVEMGRLAAEKGASEDVKAFGQKMVTDHTEMGEKMKSVAQQIGVDPPSSPTLMQQAEIKKLQGLSGAQFDEEYIRAMVKDHEEDLKDFKKEAGTGKTHAIQAAASDSEPVIAAHLTHIRKIAADHHIGAR